MDLLIYCINHGTVFVRAIASFILALGEIVAIFSTIALWIISVRSVLGDDTLSGPSLYIVLGYSFVSLLGFLWRMK